MDEMRSLLANRKDGGADCLVEYGGGGGREGGLAKLEEVEEGMAKELWGVYVCPSG